MARFADGGTEDIYNGENSKIARKTLPAELHAVAARKLDMVLNATSVADLRHPPKNKLHKLTGDRRGQHAISINDQYRICFTWTDTGPMEIEITDYH